MSSAGIDTVKHSEANISDNEEIDETSLFSAANHAIIKSDYENAKIHLLKLIKAGPYKSKYYGMLGYVYENLGDVPKSLQMRFTAANLMKQNCPSSNWVKIAEQCEENNLYPLLEQCYDKLMKLFPNDRFIALKRIRNLRKMGKSPKTVSVYGDILEYTKDKDILIEGLNLCLGKNYFPKKYYEKTRYFKQINPVTSNIVAEDVILSNIESPKSFKKREKIDDLIEIDIDQPVENSKKAKICDNKMDENFERNELFNEELEKFDFGNDEMIETNAPMSLPEDFENELFGDVRMLDDLRQFDNFDLPISKEENFKNLNFKENQNFETNKILQNENLAETKKTKPENPRRKAMYLIEKYFGFN
ncbi:General transcription factor IIIC, polypeptide 3, partial [Bonamia ostreae]